MKLLLRITVTTLVAVLLAVPSAAAKPGGGHGKGGGGKPAWAGGGKGAEKSKAAKEQRGGKPDKAEKAKKGKKDKGRESEATQACEPPAALADALGGLFGGAAACEEQEDAEQEPVDPTVLTDLEGLGPGQYCHALEAWMASNGGDFSTTFGTEVSGYANDHGKCASRRAHGEDLLAVATATLPVQPAEGAEDQQQALELSDLEGLGPGQYCHALEAWMASNGGDFSTTFGTEVSGYANDHGKCASRRAHGEDLAPAALQSVCDAAESAAETSGAELPEACQEPEQEQQHQSESLAPTGEQQATGDLATLLRVLSF